jgi:salicylate hydroxylase
VDLIKRGTLRVTKLLSCISSVLKWKLFHHHELETWQKVSDDDTIPNVMSILTIWVVVQHSTTLIGDACHPTLPYQAQGAAMAVEDGAVLGLLLGKLQSREPTGPSSEHIQQVLLLFENLRKHRTTVNVQGAVHNRWFYHLPDGEDQVDRDRALKAVDWRSPKITAYKWASPDYQSQLLGHDVLQEAENEFELWWHSVNLSSRY